MESVPAAHAVMPAATGAAVGVLEGAAVGVLVGAPVVVVTRPGPAGELLYRLARPSCQTWNPADGLRFEPWPPAPAA